MRIVIATGIFPPDIGGPATYSKLLAEELSKRGHEVVVVTYGSTVSREKDKIQDTKYKIQIISQGYLKGLKHIAYCWQVFKVGKHADVIYAQDAVSAGLPAALAAILLRKKFFIKIVGDHAWEQGMQRFGVTDLLDEFLTKKYGFAVTVLHRVQAFVASRAKRIIVPSEYLKSVVMRWGIPTVKITVIPNAISVTRTVVSKKEARRQLGLDQNNSILISVGRLVPWKGFSMLVELMSRLQVKIPHVKLIIAGDGPERKNIESEIAKHALKDIVVLTDSLPKEELGVYLAASDIFCLNTAYEGFSHQLIEAMAAGIPIIATNAGGNNEILRDGENALVATYNDLVDWEEKIFQLYQDHELSNRLSYNSKSLVEQYSIERMMEKTEFIPTRSG